MISLSNFQARSIILYLQGLCENFYSPFSERQLLGLVKRLCYVQVDSIQYVERAHHMILFARNHNYRPDMLKNLLERRRTLFENWTHDACIIPCDFYCYFSHVFLRRQARLVKKFDAWQGSGWRRRYKKLLTRIGEGEGLMSRDLKEAGSDSQAMWQWHDGKTALEFLWRTGALAISERRGFQKVYDLTERVIAPKYRTKNVETREFVDWACRSALRSLGFASAHEIAGFWNFVSVDEVKEWLVAQPKNIVREVEVAAACRRATKKNMSGVKFFARGDIEKIVAAVTESAPPKNVRVVSPFDPVVRNRKRLHWLFGFDYKIEIYVPAPKRKWGYYVFPILRGADFIGRIEMKANRKNNLLEVHNVWWENGVRVGATVQKELRRELEAHAQFAGMDGVRYVS